MLWCCLQYITTTRIVDEAPLVFISSHEDVAIFKKNPSNSWLFGHHNENGCELGIIRCRIQRIIRCIINNLRRLKSRSNFSCAHRQLYTRKPRVGWIIFEYRHVIILPLANTVTSLATLLGILATTWPQSEKIVPNPSVVTAHISQILASCNYMTI